MIFLWFIFEAQIFYLDVVLEEFDISLMDYFWIYPTLYWVVMQNTSWIIAVHNFLGSNA